MTEAYRICSKCVMDTSDPCITFDENGVCSACINNKLKENVNWEQKEKDFPSHARFGF